VDGDFSIAESSFRAICEYEMDALNPYPSDAAQEVRISVSELQPLLEQLFTKASVFQFDAVVAVSRLLEADLQGHPAHGVALVCRLLDAIDMGDIDPRGRVLTVTDTPAYAVLDGSRALGPVAATKGAELAAAKAQAGGIGIVCVGNSQTLGAAEVYVRQISEKGLIGLCCTSTGGASVCAPGTRLGAVGNSAFAYAVPVRDSHPFVFDSACGEESWSKLRLLERYGMDVPLGILFDQQGAPAESLKSAAAMLPRGGALGFGLSMLCSILAGPLCGGWMPIHKRRRVDAEDSQHFFLALDPSRFCDVEKFQNELGRTLNEIRGLAPNNPAEPVRIPGDRSAACEAEYRQTGIPLHRTIADEIKQRATKKKLPVAW
jgi:LDH2 family malate/lactate/ureidoglycolate dehydrogenase